MIDEGASGKRRKLKINLNDLVSEMEMGENLELSGYLDTETGEIFSMPDSVISAVEEGEEDRCARGLGRGACGDRGEDPER